MNKRFVCISPPDREKIHYISLSHLKAITFCNSDPEHPDKSTIYGMYGPTENEQFKFFYLTDYSREEKDFYEALKEKVRDYNE